MNGIKKSSHSLYSLNYHLIQGVKNKQKVFSTKEISELLKTQIYKISKTYDVEVLQIETNSHYFHMIFNAKPTLDIPKYLNTIKCITSREIQGSHFSGSNFSSSTILHLIIHINQQDCLKEKHLLILLLFLFHIHPLKP